MSTQTLYGIISISDVGTTIGGGTGSIVLNPNTVGGDPTIIVYQSNTPTVSTPFISMDGDVVGNPRIFWHNPNGDFNIAWTSTAVPVRQLIFMDGLTSNTPLIVDGFNDGVVFANLFSNAAITGGAGTISDPGYSYFRRMITNTIIAPAPVANYVSLTNMTANTAYTVRATTTAQGSLGGASSVIQTWLILQTALGTITISPTGTGTTIASTFISSGTITTPLLLSVAQIGVTNGVQFTTPTLPGTATVVVTTDFEFLKT